MSELIEAVVSWRLLLVAVVVYGFAPGFLLRIIVRLYPRDDPRRAELVAELYTIPRLWRPFWVAEQLETGLFEGLSARRRAYRSRRDRGRLSTGIRATVAVFSVFSVVGVFGVLGSFIGLAGVALVLAGILGAGVLAVFIGFVVHERRRSDDK